jgi:hypothetical protein
MRARGARAPARVIVQLIFPTSITDKKSTSLHHYFYMLKFLHVKIFTWYQNEGTSSGNYRYEYTADTDSWTKLWWLHYHQPEHVRACLGSAALRGGYDDDSILRLTRDD